MLIRLYYVICDDCGKPCQHFPGLADTSIEAREAARKDDWGRIRNEDVWGDYCPPCAAKRKAS